MIDVKTMEKWCEENGITPYQLNNVMAEWRRISERAKLEDAVNNLQSYIGKCYRRDVKPHSGLFPTMKRFYKVINNRASNQYRVSCLIFDEHPTYWFGYHTSKLNRPEDYYEGNFDFRGFYVNDIMIKDIDTYEEISEGLFEYHANAYLRELLDMSWVADHYRCGGKLPIDSDWEIKDGN